MVAHIPVVPVALTDWLWCLRTPAVQAYAMRDGDGIVLFDTCLPGHEHAILAALAQVTGDSVGDLRVREIVLTHCHIDHAGSAAALAAITGAPVRGPAADADVIEGRAGPSPPRLLEWERGLFARIPDPFATAPPVALHATLEEGEGPWDRPARVLAAPGHTAGSTAIHFPRERVLVAGDALASIAGEPMPGTFNVDPEAAMATVRRLAALDPELACWGHGEPVTHGAGARLRRIAPACGRPEDYVPPPAALAAIDAAAAD